MNSLSTEDNKYSNTECLCLIVDYLDWLNTTLRSSHYTDNQHVDKLLSPTRACVDHRDWREKFCWKPRRLEVSRSVWMKPWQMKLVRKKRWPTETSRAQTNHLLSVWTKTQRYGDKWWRDLLKLALKYRSFPYSGRNTEDVTWNVIVNRDRSEWRETGNWVGT